jgi:putative endonuclease
MKFVLVNKRILFKIIGKIAREVKKGTKKRLEEHNSGLSNYTSKHIPWKLVLFEEHSTKKEALKREKWYKTGVGRDWIKQQLFENKD